MNVYDAVEFPFNALMNLWHLARPHVQDAQLGIRKGWTNQCSNIFQHNTHRNYSNCIKMHQKHRNLTDVKFPNILATTASIKACVLRGLKRAICMLHCDFVPSRKNLEKPNLNSRGPPWTWWSQKNELRWFQGSSPAAKPPGFALLHHVKSPTTRRNCRRKSSQVGHLRLFPSRV